MKNITRLLAATMLSASALLCAEETSTETQQQETQVESNKEAQSATPPVKAQTTATRPSGSTKKIQAKNADNVDNYEASEEISEDLSVSYPVDI